ncbi:hypothetical protein NDU88_004992 [Pleurodeles waltl]|uniref:Uncharacterized protein n=1 Tax=Pleurodeles waltl TaxID=8319 RepID=A0AAV7UJN4_PLEWA|nr:hypothetical protein NDU88_004992 [Pleurodeles waltl]
MICGCLFSSVHAQPGPIAPGHQAPRSCAQRGPLPGCFHAGQHRQGLLPARCTRADSRAPSSHCFVSEQGTSGFTAVVFFISVTAEVRTLKCLIHASTRQRIRGHSAAAIFQPLQLRLAVACTSGLCEAQRCACLHQLDPGASRGLGQLRYTLQWRVWVSGPVCYLVRQRSSRETLLLGGHLGHAPPAIGFRHIPTKLLDSTCSMFASSAHVVDLPFLSPRKTSSASLFCFLSHLVLQRQLQKSRSPDFWGIYAT